MASEDVITNIYFHDIKENNYKIKETSVIKKAYQQINEYLNGQRQEFDIPIYIANGTKFQRLVWQALQTISYGEIKTYKDIAAMVNRPKAYRAVGRAINQNPIPIIIPCHRVIGTNGKLVGYAGGLKIKEHLLNIEKNNLGGSL